MKSMLLSPPPLRQGKIFAPSSKGNPLSTGKHEYHWWCQLRSRSVSAGRRSDRYWTRLPSPVVHPPSLYSLTPSSHRPVRSTTPSCPTNHRFGPIYLVYYLYKISTDETLYSMSNWKNQFSLFTLWFFYSLHLPHCQCSLPPWCSTRPSTDKWQIPDSHDLKSAPLRDVSQCFCFCVIFAAAMFLLFCFCVVPCWCNVSPCQSVYFDTTDAVWRIPSWEHARSVLHITHTEPPQYISILQTKWIACPDCENWKYLRKRLK